MAVTQQRELSFGEMLGSFRIERTLGTGGFGITYLALDTAFDILVAIKEYFPQNAWRDSGSRLIHCHEGEPEKNYQFGLQHFHREGQILAKFKHPNIVQARQMFPANNTAYLVMEYEEGEELEHYLHHLKRPLTYQEAEAIFNPVLDGLRAVHEQGLLHLDIKPENIYLRSDGRPMLIDFGGARHQLGKASQAVSFLVASEGYAPNEQYTGHKLQATTDIYAVGATLYRSITGKNPADAKERSISLIDKTPDPLPSIRQLVKQGQYPNHFLQAIDDALRMRMTDRPQSVRELQQRLFTEQKPPPNIKLLALGSIAVLLMLSVGWMLWHQNPTSVVPPPLTVPDVVPAPPIVTPAPAVVPKVNPPNERPQPPASPEKKVSNPTARCKSNPKLCGDVAPDY
jgi:serine/threonine protein kinase